MIATYGLDASNDHLALVVLQNKRLCNALGSALNRTLQSLECTSTRLGLSHLVNATCVVNREGDILDTITVHSQLVTKD